MHIHTWFSDGSYSPSEVVNQISDTDIGVIAITDHDTVGGVSPAIEAAGEKNIEVIPAIELSCEYNGKQVHILGYFIEHKSKSLREKLTILKNNRQQRMYEMIGKLKKMDAVIAPEEVFGLAHSGTIGRLHLAKALVKAGYAGSIYDAFKKYIGEGCPAYVGGFRLTPKEAIKIVRENSGVAVLAHPYSMKNDNWIPVFTEYGLRGIEVYYPEHTLSLTEHYRAIAAKYGLLITAGTDYHGEVKHGVKLGSIKLPLESVEKLRQEKAKIK